MFTEFDVIICVTILIFALVAFMRGAMRDLLSLFSWIGAGFSTIYFYPLVFSKTETFFTGSIPANMAAIIPTFILSLIVFSIISSIFLSGIKSSNVGMVDRSFGLLIGFIKGMIVASIIHLCIIFVTNKEPDWLQQGETYQLTKFGAKIINNAMNSSLSSDDVNLDEINKDSLRYKVISLFDDRKFGNDIEKTIDVMEDTSIDSIEYIDDLTFE